MARCKVRLEAPEVVRLEALMEAARQEAPTEAILQEAIMEVVRREALMVAARQEDLMEVILQEVIMEAVRREALMVAVRQEVPTEALRQEATMEAILQAVIMEAVRQEGPTEVLHQEATMEAILQEVIMEAVRQEVPTEVLRQEATMEAILQEVIMEAVRQEALMVEVTLHHQAAKDLVVVRVAPAAALRHPQKAVLCQRPNHPATRQAHLPRVESTRQLLSHPAPKRGLPKRPPQKPAHLPSAMVQVALPVDLAGDNRPLAEARARREDPILLLRSRPAPKRGLPKRPPQKPARLPSAMVQVALQADQGQDRLLHLPSLKEALRPHHQLQFLLPYQLLLLVR